jgi:hypothetical protein
MIDFPQNPTVGQEFTDLGIIWYWDGIKWTFSPGSSSGYLPLAGGVLTGPVGTTSTIAIPAPSDFLLGGGINGNALVTNGANVLSWENILSGATISDAPPVSPTVGQLWWDSVGGQLYVWFNDGNTTQWVIANNSVAALADFLPLVGGTLTGPLELAADPVAPLQPVTEQMFSRYPMIGDNRIINGDMQVDQRNNGASGMLQSYTVDRWLYGSNQPNIITWGQNLNGANCLGAGFPNCLGLQTTTAYTVTANDYFLLRQPIEGGQISDFLFGWAQATPITLSFWAFCSIAGSFGGAIQNAAGTRSYPFSYSLVANTWTKITISIPGDTTGTWEMYGNGPSMFVSFDLGCGANYHSPANAWVNGIFLAPIGGTNLVETNGAQFNITGIKLEVGSVATPFNRKSSTESWADCQRYYNSFPLSMLGYGASSTAFGYTVTYPFMRVAPTITPSNVLLSFCFGLTVQAPQLSSSLIYANVSQDGGAQWTADFSLDAEL